jgi:hypothetical protein
VGHKTIAYIAQDRLTPSAKKAIRRLLGPGQNLVSVSTWADMVAHTDRTETAPWHYIQVNVRQEQNVYDLEDVCRDHQCVVDQIEKDEAVLKDRWSSFGAKKEALKFLVHFVGDVHQPLHCAEDNDRGGNEKWFRFYGSKHNENHYTWVNLHSFWDNLLEAHAKENPRKLATELEKNITPDDESSWQSDDPKAWAYESFRVARDNIYSELPSGPLLEKNRWGRDLPEDYYTDSMRRIVDERLEKAGVRLAYVLNQIFQNE